MTQRPSDFDASAAWPGRAPAIDRGGLAAAISAYVLWGVFPLYWFLLKDIPSLQIIAHRVIWCGVFVVGFLLLRDGAGWLRQALAGRRVLPMLIVSSLLISANWGIYIWAVTHERVVDASLGYFINPLVSVLLGVVVLRERLAAVQWLCVGIATFGVVWLAVIHGEPPWIALALAGSFAMYGLIRKVAAVEAVPGLAIESVILFLPALAWLLHVQLQGDGAFGHQAVQQGMLATDDASLQQALRQSVLRNGWLRDILLIVGGALTALPLIGFAYGARRIPYSLVGILQYISPTLQLLCGVWLLGEPFDPQQAVGFGCIWIALILYAANGWRTARRVRGSR